MKLIAAAALAAFVLADGAVAAERPRCGVPDYLLFGESPLKRVSNVVATQKRLLTAEDLAKGMDKLVADEKPNLVVWQTGTIDAIRRLDPDAFKSALEDGGERLHKGGADVLLMNMQYSPRTETMISVSPYADVMRVVAQHFDTPLFDRLGIMRHWSEAGTFDLYVVGRDNVLAQRVHDCIGRAIAALVINAGKLPAGPAAQAGQ